ncbi:uncharacterized protein LOC113204517 isoform X2 [Frankliniella occidentalis]|uniref:Uncharacterized protein LOC113204517 isoform X2 n=1 Tax=Frankliniella occidentalis TaxID=133901 RepID=A0A6J1S2Q3_FRAOC|nr:uncharacterized protein LOC113204517 isoform X2 [Frankliniella occidentalis]
MMCSSEMMDNPGYQHDEAAGSVQQRPLPGTPGGAATADNSIPMSGTAAPGPQQPPHQHQPLHQPLYHALQDGRRGASPQEAAGRRARSLRAPPRRPPPSEDASGRCTLNNSRVSLASWSPGPDGLLHGAGRSAGSSPGSPGGPVHHQLQHPAHPPHHLPGSALSTLSGALAGATGTLTNPSALKVRRNFISSPPEYQATAHHPGLLHPPPPAWGQHKLHPLRNALAYPLLQVCNNQLQLHPHLGEDGLVTKKPCRCPPEEPVHEYSSILGPAPHKAALAASTEPLYWSPVLKRAAGGGGAGAGVGGVGASAAQGSHPVGDEGTLKKGWSGTSRVFKYIVQRRGSLGAGGGAGAGRGWRCLLALLAAAAAAVLLTAGLAAYLTDGFGLLRSTEAALRGNGMVTLAGEFRVVSERWSPSLGDEQSAAWRTLADRIQLQLDALFEASALAAHYRHSTVTSLRPSEDVLDAIDVDCDVVLGDAAHMPDLVERAGLAFLRGLRRRAGRAWLGDLAVDVQSIGFVGAPIATDEDGEEAGPSTPTPTAARADPAVPGWAPWSSWSECYWTGSSGDVRGGGSAGTMVRLRSRTCSLDGGRGRALDGPEPCLLRLPSAGSPFEMEPCQSQPAPGAPTAATILIQDTVVALGPSKPSPVTPGATPTTSTARPPSATSPTSSSSSTSTVITPSLPLHPATPVTSASTPSSEPHPSPFSMTTLLVPVIVTQRPTTTSTTTAAPRREPRHCDECLTGEVCVALGEEAVPRCHAVKDPLDPTGCGGHCKLNFEFCQRLDVDAFRCVDDSVCLPGEWRCGNQLCIPLVKRCDGHFNCYDHTDEHNCECNLQTHFQCGNKTSCLPKSKRCDGVVDCWDAADELNCTRTCPRQDQFTCSNGQCISHARFCDGFADCGDKSDEPFGCGGDCKNHEWKCGNGRCIRKRAVCNGVDDCGDLSDEKECRKSRLPGS